MQTIDQDTFELLKGRNDGAHHTLYELYRARVYAFCYHMTQDRELAADLTQDVFVKVLSRIDTLDDPRAFPSWLFAIARNEVYGHFRKPRVQSSIEAEDVWETQTPVDVVIASERAALVRGLVQTLRPAYREALLLREFEGLSYAEIAAVVGCTETAVKARLFKARRALLEKLTPILGEE